MSVSGINSVPTYQEPDPLKPTGKKELDRQDFLTLFVTQLQYQDPMKPMDTYEMSSQLAQFSSMEATMKMSDSMDALLDYQTSQNNLQLITLLDTTVQANGNMLAVKDSAVSVTEFELEDATTDCVVEIYDQRGSLVRTVSYDGVAAGTMEMGWDGLDNAGNQLPDGVYLYKVKAFDEAGRPIGVNYRSTGTVTGLGFESGQALLTLDDYITVPVSDILEVN